MNTYAKNKHPKILRILDFVEECLSTEGLPFIFENTQDQARYIPVNSLADEWKNMRSYVQAYSSSFFFHPAVQLFFDAAESVGWLKHPPMSIKDEDFEPRLHMLTFNALVKFIQDTGKSSAYRERIRKLANDRKRQFDRAKALLNRLFECHARLLVLRVEFSMGRKKDSRHVARDFARLQRLWRNKPAFEAIVGYVAKMEYTPRKGYHLHAMILMDGSRVRKDVYLAQQLGEMWKQVTDDQGIYFNCNVQKYQQSGISMVSYHDVVKRATLENTVLSYFFKDQQQVLVKKNRKDRTLFLSQKPALPSHLGRPRGKFVEPVDSEFGAVSESEVLPCEGMIL